MFDEYPEVTPEFLSTYPDNDPTDSYNVDRILFQQPHRKAMITSLFCAYNACLYPNQYPSPSSAVGSPWWERYLEKLRVSLKWFDSYYYYQDWKVRIYIDPSLVQLSPTLTGLTRRLEFYVLSTPSAGHNPGALWRFLAMEDSSLDIGCVFDCDEHIQSPLPCIDAFVKNPAMGLGRFVPYGVAEIPEQGQRIYTPISAHMVCFRPNILNLPIHRLLLQFVSYRKSLAITDRPWEYPGMTNETPYTKSYGLPHIFGWGNHWYIYGFDERFLKHVVYPYAVRKGILQSWLFKPQSMYTEPEIHKDFTYVDTNPRNDKCLLFTK